MGTLIYGHEDQRIAIEDRVLAHLQMVIVAKLRRAESFVFSWEPEASPEEAAARRCIWLHPAMFLVFEYEHTQHPPINRDWLELLSVAANSSTGLRLVPEPTQ